jgi:photosystem II stability/assembly factor-like uncharacterized protein
MKQKKYLAVLMLGAVVGLGMFVWSRSTGTSESMIQNQLIPESVISHGHGLAVDPNDSRKVYIATHHGLLVLQNDKDLYRVGASTDDYMGFSVHPTEANVFFSSGHPSLGGNIGFMKSADGGFTWKKISSGVDGPVDFHSMALSRVNPNLMYGSFQGNIQRSTDQGKTWEIVSRDLSPVYLAADSQDENRVYAVDAQGQGVLVSIDKGKVWESLSSELEGGLVSTIALHPTDANIIFAYSEKLGGLGKSTDAGVTWSKTKELFNGEMVLHLAFDQNNPATLYALTVENKLFKSTDTGDNWMQVR